MIPIRIEGLPTGFNFHFIMESLAFIVAFRVYWYQRKNYTDTISTLARLSTILGAMIGALIGSRLVGYLEVSSNLTSIDLRLLMYNKSIAGGFFGGILGVELVKFILKIKSSTGDVYVFPILIGLIIGRTGCFLSGVDDGTIGLPTDSMLGMDLGDGIKRFPTALFELIFAFILLLFYIRIRNYPMPLGYRFMILMILYFMFRFFIEFLKPLYISYLGLNAVQCCCILVFIYYTFYLKYKPK
ncbi:MAG: prolipoprotein diacylglyceryl transferase [Chitinophagales bacterium]|nr:prolipoprotein diacylglyceryl transferase [Chitinophagales bacterium]